MGSTPILIAEPSETSNPTRQVAPSAEGSWSGPVPMQTPEGGRELDLGLDVMAASWATWDELTARGSE